MTPGTRLLEAVRDALTHKGAPEACDACMDPESCCQQYGECDCPLDPSCHTTRIRWINERRDALLTELESVRALYPAAHAIGDRVSVRDWLNLRTPDGPSELDFTGEVVGVQFIDGKVLYVVDAGAGLFASGRQVVDSAFVHPAPRTLPLYRAPGVSGGPDWTVEDVVLDEPSPTHVPMDGRRVTEESPGVADVQKATFGPITSHEVTRTTTLLIPGRVQVTTHTDEHGVKTTETVDLRDRTSPHGRLVEELRAEMARNVRESKDFKAGMLAGLEYAAEVVERIWPKQ